MDLRQLAFFVGVAESLNFSRAAEKLSIAQPALSRQIQQLEEDLGVLLFKRDKRNVALTPAGMYLLTQARQLRATVADVVVQTRRVHNGLIGTLRIGHPGSALYSVLPDVLATLATQYPDVTTSLSEATEQELIEALFSHRVDVGLTREVNVDERVESELLFSEPFALVVPEGHWLNADTFEHLGQCRHEPFILCSLNSSYTYGRVLLGLFEEHGYVPRQVYEANYGATVLRLVEKNLGIAILPISYRQGMSLRLRFLPLPHETQLHLIWRKGDQNPVLRNFLTICHD
ncbi:MAG: LysR family transcriptional regulator, partial [Bacteroidetes bacterium]|nr:LysR family transcriptional regulator [Fibrella sp.]